MPRGVYDRTKATSRPRRKRRNKSDNSELNELTSQLIDNYGKLGAKQILRDLAKSKIAFRIK